MRTANARWRPAALLDAPVRVVMLKGRGNYLYRSRLEFVLANARQGARLWRFLTPGSPSKASLPNSLAVLIEYFRHS